jgi:hypothetical protein
VASSNTYSGYKKVKINVVMNKRCDCVRNNVLAHWIQETIPSQKHECMRVYRWVNWALSRSEKRKIETGEMRFLRRVSGCALTDYVRNTTIRNALQIYALEERI